MGQDMTILGWICDEVDAYEEDFARANPVAMRLLAEGKAALVAARAAVAREEMRLSLIPRTKGRWPFRRPVVVRVVGRVDPDDDITW